MRFGHPLPGAGEGLLCAMLLSRRHILAASVIIPAMGNSVRAVAAKPVSLAYAAGRLSWPGGETRAVCGRGGVRADKREGHPPSPHGPFPLLSPLYPPHPLPRPPPRPPHH